MNETDEKIAKDAEEYIKRNSKVLIEKFASKSNFISDLIPVTLFMAGSPGAGKTEISKRLIAKFDKRPIRIDADEIREMCPGYNGQNAHLFQKAASKGVNILYDHARKHGVNVIIDGTFAYKDSIVNIEMSLKRKRRVEIFYVYQDPLVAWSFTQKREALEKRKVSKDVFINAFLLSKENVNNAKKHFGDQIELNLIIKDFESGLEKLELNVQNIDHHINKSYTVDELNDIII